jgi:aspartyl-tRNA(Asn)/glutamyl-tRNA(Gln) amidotransferase subunit B
MRSPAEAGAYLAKLRTILRYVGSCDGNMDQGSMRADVNVSVRRPGEEFGTRTETKNVNSVRFVMAVVESEARRQVDLIEDGGTVVQETRLYDPDRNVTRSMRSKEDAHDYRYFPDPDLLPLEIDDAFIAECRASLPELPDAKRRRYENALGLSPYDSAQLTQEVETYLQFEEMLGDVTAKSGKAERDVAKRVANWILSERPGVERTVSITIDDARRAAANTALVVASLSGAISPGKAKEIYAEVLAGKVEVEAGIAANAQTSDTGAIDAAVTKVLADNADKVEQYRAGKEALFGFFVGQTMKAMAGKANPQVVNEAVKKALG